MSPFFKLFLLSQSLNPGFLGAVRMGGMELFGEIELDNDEDGSAAGDDDDDACLAVSEDPVSI